MGGLGRLLGTTCRLGEQGRRRAAVGLAVLGYDRRKKILVDACREGVDLVGQELEPEHDTGNYGPIGGIAEIRHEGFVHQLVEPLADRHRRNIRRRDQRQPNRFPNASTDRYGSVRVLGNRGPLTTLQVPTLRGDRSVRTRLGLGLAETGGVP